ncbi:dienelactone hydrolase family protein [Caulobacter sp. RL271]|jgi:dienelactone hydrolase|uniref:Dienelactone hydrolase family protein n=1 Tax=Caulobacter segnis TaxID=88688 RepID=A0ABY4ZTU7_9CAUL|nr:dienelactone hydrolase family protein [Caulobacter segnis]USQ95935.1 dienelactone hydrolase family protein [Caulobacter segnis]
MSNGDVLAGFTRFEFDDGRWTREVFRIGSGPAVIVIHEVPGLHPGVLAFARDLADAGLTAFCPSLFGQPGKQVGRGYAIGEILKNVCVRREFVALKDGRSSPIVDWLRALARQVHAECGGKGVGAVGMCFTGGFALAMMTEPAVVAPVLSQPSLPLNKPGGLDCSASELACAKKRFKDENLSLLALRFTSDKLVPNARIARLKAEFGDKVEVVELSDSDAAPGQPMAPHSVLTLHLHRSVPDSGSMRARDKVIAFFKERVGA